MALIVLTSAGLTWITQLFAEEITTAATVIAVGSGTPSSSGLGNEFTGNGFSRGVASATYADGAVTITRRFTASGADVRVSEMALYSTDSTPVLIGYVQYNEFDLEDEGLIPDGYYFDASFVISVSIGTVTATPGEGYNITYTGTAQIALSEASIIDPNLYACTTGLCFNGKPIRNGYIESQSAPKDGKIWDISGYTEDFTDIINLQQYAGPVEIYKTITGKTDVNSMLLPGTLRVMNTTTRTYDVHTFCWINGDISVETHGNGWYFSLQIVQSYKGVEA